MKLNYFNFKRFQNKILLTNDLGCYLFLDEEEFKTVLTGEAEENPNLKSRLLETQMAYDETDLEFSSRYRYQLLDAKSHLNIATSLHIFVVTTACNLNCVYCQANNGRVRPHQFMDRKTAEKAVDIALQSPARFLDFEFQGGEPLLNFEIIKHIVNYTEVRKGTHEVRYNIVSNLTLLTDEILVFLKDHHFGISTSIDGDEIVHNVNRPFLDGHGSFSTVQKSIQKIREQGIHIGAIETTTRTSLKYPREIVRSYVDLGFDSIFLRPLTPLGKAAANWDEIGYTPEEFIEFYKTALDELLLINKEGRFIKESHTSIFLARIEGRGINYMELRSPCGAGIGQLAYFADGNIFTCDEGRMLYEMGQNTFCLGNVDESSYSDLIQHTVCRSVCASSILETIPSCCDCVYQSYCGTCPVVNYAFNKDIIEKTPRGYRCRLNQGILDVIFTKLLTGEHQTIDTFMSWSN